MHLILKMRNIYEVKNEFKFGFAMLQCDEIFAEMLR